MKNIFVLPTDRPSFLFKDIKDNLMFNKDWVEIPIGRVNQNIYITSNEEISGLENNIWVYNNGRVWLWENTMALRSNNKPKKIILTTDQDLIKDGVQAIDDEFLEWFAKNSTCEFIQTTELSLFNGDTGESGHYKYEIIIPQEEPKQDTMKQTAVEYLYKIIHARIHIDKDLSEYLNQAKEMEKQQIVEAWIAEDNPLQRLRAEQYYKKTFKSE